MNNPKLKITGWLIIWLIFSLFTGCNAQQEKEISKINDFASLQAKLQDPPSEYRSTPLWDWYDKIT